MIDYEIIARVLEIYTWFVASIIVIFIGGVGLFYQKKFNVNTHYYLFLIPLLLLLFVLIQIQIFVEESFVTELVEAFSGLMALSLMSKIYIHMTRGTSHFPSCVYMGHCSHIICCCHVFDGNTEQAAW